MNNLSLEEELAEDFREFVMQGGRDTRSLGRKIIDFFKSLFIKTKYWKHFRPSSIYYFRAINEGKYSGKDIPVTTSNEARYKQEEYTQEMQDILAKAPRDSEGRLLAPNGEVSNLTERQYAQVRTKAFKNWFGDWEINRSSKVLDENGEPLVVYHGTNVDINDFNYNDDRMFNTGFYFSSDKEYARNIAKAKYKTDDVIVIPVFLQIFRPTYTDTPIVSKEVESIRIYEGDRYDDGIIGHDKITEELPASKGTEYVVTKPRQIKSATENIGTFSRINDDIRYRKVPNSSFESLDAEIQENLLKKGWTIEKFDSISQEERDQAVKCIAF